MHYLALGTRGRRHAIDHTPRTQEVRQSMTVNTMTQHLTTAANRVCVPVWVSPGLFCPGQAGFNWRSLDTQTGSDSDDTSLTSKRVISLMVNVHVQAPRG